MTMAFVMHLQIVTKDGNNSSHAMPLILVRIAYNRFIWLSLVYP